MNECMDNLIKIKVPYVKNGLPICNPVNALRQNPTYRLKEKRSSWETHHSGPFQFEGFDG